MILVASCLSRPERQRIIRNILEESVYFGVPCANLPLTAINSRHVRM